MTHGPLADLSETVVKSWFQNGDLDPYSPAQDRIVRYYIRRLVERKCGTNCPQLDDISQELLLRIRSSLASMQLNPDENGIAVLERIIRYQAGHAISTALEKSGKPMKRDFGLVITETKPKHPNPGMKSRVVVKDVLPGSAADSAGIMRNDIIVGINETKIVTKKEYTTAVEAQSKKSRYKLTLTRGHERLHTTLTSADRDHDYTYREAPPDALENLCIETVSEEEKLLSVLAARAALDRMKNEKAKRAFELHCLAGMTYSQMIELDKDCFCNENYCSVLVGRGFKEAGMNLEEYATEKLKYWSTSVTKEQKAIYRRIQKDARKLVKRFEKY